MANVRVARRLFRIVVLSLGSLLAGILLFAFVPKLFSRSTSTSPAAEWEGRVMIAMFVTFLLGYAVGWWRLLWGGLLILLAALLVSVLLSVNGNFGGLIFGIPLFFLGALYLLLYWSERRASGNASNI